MGGKEGGGWMIFSDSFTCGHVLFHLSCPVVISCILSLCLLCVRRWVQMSSVRERGGLNMWTEGKQGRMGGYGQGKGNREGRSMWTGGERCGWVDRWTGWGEYLRLS